MSCPYAEYCCECIVSVWVLCSCEWCLHVLHQYMYVWCMQVYLLKEGGYMSILNGSQLWVSLTDDICSSICAAECNIPCENGGTCTTSDTCTCAVGWTGVKCETGWYCDTMYLYLKLFVSTLVIQILPSFMCIGLEGSVEKVLERKIEQWVMCTTRQ